MWTKRDIKTTVEEIFLRNIEAKSLDEINGWFKKSFANEWRIDRIKEAVDLALQFKDKKVTIVGDYDADGITATAILILALRWAGFKNVSFRIPKRFSEGFGINPVIIDEITEGLIITCDNGVAQSEAIKKARDKGLSVIIIDHHLPVETDGVKVLPEADVIIDPNAIEGSADFSDYCGAGLSYRFSRELLSRETQTENAYRLLEGLAAIGTVADVVKLRGENYVIVRNGLKKLGSRFAPLGANILVKAATNGSTQISATDVGFKIGPVINAASRMLDDGAKEVVTLLTKENNEPECIRMAEKLLSLNTARKAAKREANEEAENIIKRNCLYGEIPLILYIPHIAEGIIGIVAGNLCEKYEVPAIVLTDTDKENVLKGSARSCGNCNIKEKLDMVSSDCMAAYGGHSGAAGLSVFKDKIVDFIVQMQNACSDFVNEDNKKDTYDLEIAASEIAKTIKELSKYEPFGEGNEPIVFKINGYSPIPVAGKYCSFIGDGTIMKMSGTNADAVGFGMTVETLAEIPKKVNLLGKLSYNVFGGVAKPQIEFSGIDFEKTTKVKTALATLLEKEATKP